MSQMVEVDWAGWVERWDRQQAGYLPDREEQFGLMFDIVERVAGKPRRLLDLACGPGSIARRAAARFDGAEVLAVDVDPFLLEIGRRTVDRVTFLEGDLRRPGWDDVLGDEPLDAVCSATAVHYLDTAAIEALATTLAARLRPGGVFVNVDTLRLGPDDVPRLDELAVSLRQHIWDGSHAAGVESWQAWWDSARAEPAFAGLLAERDRRQVGGNPGPAITLPGMVAALRAAGFAEVGVLAQTADKHTLAAIR
jgi:SAM-dependent methyltransferase